MAVLLSLISPWKRKETKRKNITTRGIRIWSPGHPSTITAEQDLTLLSRRNMLLSLWYSDSTVNAFFKFLISLYFPSHAVSDIFSLFDTFSHFRNLKKCIHRGVTIPEGQQHVSPAQSSQVLFGGDST